MLNLTRTNSIIMNGPVALKCIAIIQIQNTKKWGKYQIKNTYFLQNKNAELNQDQLYHHERTSCTQVHRNNTNTKYKKNLGEIPNLKIHMINCNNENKTQNTKNTKHKC